MPKLRSLSGADLIRIFTSFGLTVQSRRSSHIRLTIMDHKEVDKGTLAAIFRQALRYIPEIELKPQFFTE